jgi:predicted RecA/RadA family phage recombinase
MPVTIIGPELRCPLGACETFEYTASGAKLAGAVELINDTLAIWLTNVASGSVGALAFKAPRVMLPCATAPTAGYPVGTKMYWDTADAELNTSSSGNRECAVVTEAAAFGATDVEVAFDGREV